MSVGLTAPAPHVYNSKVTKDNVAGIWIHLLPKRYATACPVVVWSLGEIEGYAEAIWMGARGCPGESS
jgi:hypothetical protein